MCRLVSVCIALAPPLMRPIGGRLIHCEQRQPEAAHLHQDTMQCGLICKSTRQEGFPMREIGDGESIEPGRPVGIEVAFDTDFVRAHHFSFQVPLLIGTSWYLCLV